MTTEYDYVECVPVDEALRRIAYPNEARLVERALALLPVQPGSTGLAWRGGACLSSSMPSDAQVREIGEAAQMPVLEDERMRPQLIMMATTSAAHQRECIHGALVALS